MAARTTGIDRNEEITSLSPYVYFSMIRTLASRLRVTEKCRCVVEYSICV